MTGDTFLLIPMMPTPNGPLHLGHIAGPYLRMDVLARFLRSTGRSVLLISSTDAHDSYVLKEARKQRKTPSEIASDYTDIILADFERMSIRFDVFDNPRSPKLSAFFAECHESIIKHLVEIGATTSVEYALADHRGRILEPFEVAGICGGCMNEIIGLNCEVCGFSNGVEHVLDPKTNDGVPAQLISRKGLAVRWSCHTEILQTIAKYSLPASFVRCAAAIIGQGSAMLTAPGSVGVCTMRGVEAPIYNTYFGHAIYCSSRAAERDKRFNDAFSEGSGVMTVTSLGLDNCGDVPASVSMAIAMGRRPFDYCYGSHFLNLNGEKFSTSRNHAVFVSRVSSNVSTDCLRLYLGLMSPEAQEEDFAVSEFVRFHNQIYHSDILPRVVAAANAIRRRRALQSEWHSSDATVPTCHREGLDLSAFSLRRHSQGILDALRAFEVSSTDEGPARLKSLISVASPLLPGLCRSLQQYIDGYARCPKARVINDSDLPVGL